MQHNTSTRQDSIAVVVGFAVVIAVTGLFLMKRSLSSDKTPETVALGEKTVERKVPALEVREVFRRVSSATPPKIVDVRTRDEYDALHIPDSVLTDPDAVGGLLIGEGEEILLVASDDISAMTASEILTGIAVDHYVIEGGLPEWESIGGTLVTYGNPSSMKDQSKVEMLTKEDFVTLFSDPAAGYRLLDVRSDAPQVPGALDIPLASLESRRDEIPAATNIALCGSDGLEAFQAAVRLFDLGFRSVKTLDGACPDVLTTE